MRGCLCSTVQGDMAAQLERQNRSILQLHLGRPRRPSALQM